MSDSYIPFPVAYESKPCYILVTGRSYDDDFVNQVNARMKEGYQPLGGPMLSPDRARHMIQAMTIKVPFISDPLLSVRVKPKADLKTAPMPRSLAEAREQLLKAYGKNQDDKPST